MMNSHKHDHEHRPFAEKLKHPFADLRQRLKGDVILLLLDSLVLYIYVPSAEI